MYMHAFGTPAIHAIFIHPSHNAAAHAATGLWYIDDTLTPLGSRWVPGGLRTGYGRGTADGLLALLVRPYGHRRLG